MNEYKLLVILPGCVSPKHLSARRKRKKKMLVNSKVPPWSIRFNFQNTSVQSKSANFSFNFHVVQHCAYSWKFTEQNRFWFWVISNLENLVLLCHWQYSQAERTDDEKFRTLSLWEVSTGLHKQFGFLMSCLLQKQSVSYYRFYNCFWGHKKTCAPANQFIFLPKLCSNKRIFSASSFNSEFLSYIKIFFKNIFFCHFSITFQIAFGNKMLWNMDFQVRL